MITKCFEMKRRTLVNTGDISPDGVVVKAKIQRTRPRPGPSRPRPGHSRPGPFKAKAEVKAWTLKTKTKTKARTLESKANFKAKYDTQFNAIYHTPLT